MRTGGQKFRHVLFVSYLIVIHVGLVYLAGERFASRYLRIQPVNDGAVMQPAASREAIPTPLPVPELFADQLEPAGDVNATADSNVESQPPHPLPGVGLVIPVVGVRPDQLIDTFSSSRSEGRMHDAIDIAAPAGTPVVAATDGEIVRFFDSDRGGVTVYQLTADRRYMLYYAHLQRRADGLSPGMRVQRGTTIGFVGDTGNAGPGNYHLHFSIALAADPKRFSSGSYLNPYPLLKNGEYPQ